MVKHQVFSVWFIIFIIWAFYRSRFFLPEFIDELLVKPLIFLLPVIYVVIIREKKRLSELGLISKPKEFFVDLYLGVALGIAFAFEGLFINFLKYGQFSFEPSAAMRVSGGILPFLLINTATSFWEEILGRGYIYQRLLQASKNNQFWAATVSSFLFLFLHIPIVFTRLHLTGTSLIVYPISILLLGMTNCYIFSLRKSLTLPILIHLFWNMTVALYL
jgi:membrane protease YdiL (CAAX protease family)